MKIVIDIPKSLYANLQKIQNGSIAAKRILECVRNGKQTDVPDTNVGECGGCISRQAAIDLADELKDDLPDDDHLSDMVMSHNEGILEYQTKLSLLPPVTPQQKTGRWVRMSDLPNDVDDRFKCSRCGNIVHYNNVMNLRTFSRWCGRCGSDNG